MDQQRTLSEGDERYPLSGVARNERRNRLRSLGRGRKTHVPIALSFRRTELSRHLEISAVLLPREHRRTRSPRQGKAGKV